MEQEIHKVFKYLEVQRANRQALVEQRKAQIKQRHQITEEKLNLLRKDREKILTKVQEVLAQSEDHLNQEIANEH